MSDKARELLERALKGFDEFYGEGGSYLGDEIRDYLAEPEKKVCDVCGEGKIIEMKYWLCDSCRTEYTDAQQMKSIKEQTVKARASEKNQEPLSGEYIVQQYLKDYLTTVGYQSFFNGVRFAEKHHGIGGEE